MLSREWKSLAVPLVIICIAGCVSRLVFGEFLRDQAELVVFSQTLQPLYDEQIPVLTWIMTGLFKATNYFILWPDIYKYLCLGLAVSALYDIGRNLTGQAYLGVISGLSVFFLPTFHVDMLSEVTHTAALLAATGLSTAWFVRRSSGELKPRLFLALAAFWTLGLLAKHTMVFVIAAQCVAFAWVYRPSRHVVIAFVKTLALTLVGAAPFYGLLIAGKQSVASGLQEFFRTEGFRRGLIDLPESILGEGALFIIGAIIIAICMCLKRRRSNLDAVEKPLNTQLRFLWLTSALILLCFIPFIIAGDIAVVRDRWLAPALMLWGPLFAHAFLRFSDRAGRRAAIAFSAIISVLGLYAAVEPGIKARSGAVELDTWPVAKMSKDVRANYPNATTFIAYDDNLVATLKRQNPTLKIYSIKTKQVFEATAPSNFMIIRESQSLSLDLKAVNCASEITHTLPIHADTKWSYTVQVCKRLT